MSQQRACSYKEAMKLYVEHFKVSWLKTEVMYSHNLHIFNLHSPPYNLHNCRLHFLYCAYFHARALLKGNPIKLCALAALNLAHNWPKDGRLHLFYWYHIEANSM